MIDATDSKKPLQNVSIIKVMKMLVSAQTVVTPRTVKNYFKKAGFSEIEGDDEIHVSDDLFAALEDSIKQFGLLEQSFKDLAVDDVVDFVKSLVK